MSPAAGKNLLVAGAGLAVLGHVAVSLGSDDGSVKTFTRSLFVATVLVQMLAVWHANAVRKAFDEEDRGRRTWLLVSLFLGLRLLAEIRLSTLYFELVPSPIQDSETAFFTYKVVFRYLYTLSDFVAIAAIVSAIRSLRAAGLDFDLRARDFLAAAALAAIPLFSFVLRANLGSFLQNEDPTIVTYRLVAVSVGAAIAGLSLLLLRLALQMGGGLLAWVWGTAAFAGIARTLSFLVLGLLSHRWSGTAEFVEQLLLWSFACGWLLAALYHRKLLSPAS